MSLIRYKIFILLLVFLSKQQLEIRHDNSIIKVVTLEGDSVKLFQSSKKSIIVISKQPQCSSCLKVLSFYFKNVEPTYDCYYYILNPWYNSVYDRRLEVIFNQSYFPLFKTLFYQKDNENLNLISAKSPSLLLWNGDSYQYISNDSLFEESNNKLYLKQNIKHQLDLLLSTR